MTSTTPKGADTAAEFNSAKDGVQTATKSIKEARRTTRGVAKSDQRMTRLESTAARLARELKDLGDRFNAATDPELKESLASKVVAINAKIIAFNTDVNTQLEQLRTDVGQNTDDIAVEKSRNDDQDVEIDMLSRGHQSLSQRVSSITTGSAKTPWWQFVVAGIMGIIAGNWWNNLSIDDSFTLSTGQVVNVPYTAANSVLAAIGAGIAAAALLLYVLSFFGKKVKTDTTTTRHDEVTTTPPRTVPAPQVKRTSIRTTVVPPNDGSADPTPTQVLATEPGVPTGARS